jgi:hypothetical protein
MTWQSISHFQPKTVASKARTGQAGFVAIFKDVKFFLLQNRIHPRPHAGTQTAKRMPLGTEKVPFNRMRRTSRNAVEIIFLGVIHG